MTRSNWLAVALLCHVAVALAIAAAPTTYGLPVQAGAYAALSVLPATIVLHVLDPFGRIQALASGRATAADGQMDP